MGGRGSSNPGNAMNVDYDNWGEMLFHKPIVDKAGDTIGYLNDEIRYDMVEDIRPTTKKEVLSEIDGWRDDDGYWTDDDMAGYITYKDGSFVDVKDLDGKNYKKSGIVGAYISTGDFEAAWGYEYNSHKKEFVPMTTWSLDGESGKANTYSGYKAVSRYKVRVKTTFNNKDSNGRYRTKHEIVRRSKRVKVE